MSFYHNFLNLCNKSNKTPSKVALEIGFSKAAVNRWKNGSLPSDAAIMKIADYFHVSIDSLKNSENSYNTVTGNNNIIGNGNTVGTTLTEHQKALLDLFGKMDIVKQAQLLTYAAELVKEK